MTLFEANDYIGGHTNTVDVTRDGITAPVDTGFLVFNDRTYPNLVALFDELGVASVASEMSFSVRVDEAAASPAVSRLFRDRAQGDRPLGGSVPRHLGNISCTCARICQLAPSSGLTTL